MSTVPSAPPAEGRPAVRGRARGERVPVLAAAVGVVALVVAAAAVGAAVTGAAAPDPLADPGPLVRWGLPAVRAVADLAAAVTVGLLVLAAVALPTRVRDGGPRLAHPPALPAACAVGALWALAELGRLVLGYAAATGQDLQEPGLGTQLVSYVTQVSAGRSEALGVVVAALVATVAAGAARLSTARLLAVLAAAGLVAPLLGAHGHAAGGPEVLVLVLHVAGVAVWAGGLGGLLLLAPGLGRALEPAASRWAPLAEAGFVLVAASGVASAWQQLDGLRAATTAYGAVVGVKALLLVGLGVAGVRHRRRTIPLLAAGVPGTLARFAAADVVLLAVALGLSGALAAGGSPADPPRGPAGWTVAGLPLLGVAIVAAIVVVARRARR
jgi:putative copper resistance protein D